MSRPEKAPGLDMSGCVCAGEIGFRASVKPKSICWECRKPVAECEWLTHTKPYPGSVYYRQDARGEYSETLYIIVECPEHK